MNEVICGDNVVVMKQIPSGSVDLIITSPPYGSLRDYKGCVPYDFKVLASEIERVLKPGGVCVWNEADEVVEGSESGESFRHALHFKDICKLRLYDTMIYQRAGMNYPSQGRYYQMFEYVFILSKGRPKTFNPIEDVPRKWEGSWGKHSVRNKAGELVPSNSEKDGKARSGRDDEGTGKYGYCKRGNIWMYANGAGHGSKDKIAFEHPARFPDKLAADHIKSWSNPGDIVIDPFNGSGTTTKMAALLGRKYIGIEISQEYVDIANERLKGVTCQTSLLS